MMADRSITGRIFIVPPQREQWTRHTGLVVAIEAEAVGAGRVRRLVHRDVIDGLAVPIVHGEGGPVREQARLDPQPDWVAARLDPDCAGSDGRERIRRVFTLDQRDFRLYRAAGLGRLSLLP